ncbi:MAG: ABC transporter substrate-binding protein [Candidatus Kerfeldbacteria bacterium]|nr:ABC transporter substrate-binding protein [Candidatus Kerfeldbacteria bacterium]
MTISTPPPSSLIRLRWRLVGLRDQLRRAPGVGRRIAAVIVEGIIAFISLPALMRNVPQRTFPRVARRERETYVESYDRYKTTGRVVVPTVLTIIVVGVLAIVSTLSFHTLLRPAQRLVTVGVLKRVATLDPLVQSFQEGLMAHGFRVALTTRTGSTTAELTKLATALVAKRVDVLLTLGDQATLAGQTATQRTRTPTLFFTTSDPVALGVVQRFTPSGTNLVGVGRAILAERQVRLLQQLAPTLDTLAILFDPNDATSNQFRQALEDIAASEAIDVRGYPISRESEVLATFDAIVADGADAVYLAPGATTSPLNASTAAAARDRRLLLMGNSERNAEAGAAVAFSVDLERVGGQLADLAHAILQGAPPEQLSVLLPSHGFLAFNRKTAEAIGLVIPPDLLAEADALF